MVRFRIFIQRYWHILLPFFVLATCLSLNWSHRYATETLGYKIPAAFGIALLAGTILSISWLNNVQWDRFRRAYLQIWNLPLLLIPGLGKEYMPAILIFLSGFLLQCGLYKSGFFSRMLATIKNAAATTPAWKMALSFVVLACIPLIWIKAAWVTEDAFITFRTVDNWLHGYGMRWNIDERVQSYTHPLWMLWISLLSLFTKEQFYTAAISGLLFSGISVYITMRRQAFGKWGFILGCILFCSSKAFVDYTTSGLENSLGYLWAALFLHSWFFMPDSSRKLWVLSLISGLAATTRHDTILFYVPALLYYGWSSGNRHPGKILMNYIKIGAGHFTLILWTGFSLLYYGFPFPNTAYAKLKTGIPQNEFILQGLQYYLDSLARDPFTLLVICMVFVWIFAQKQLKFILPLTGVIFYLFYTIKIGGDFMSGRFLAIPFFIAASLLLMIPIQKPIKAGIASLGIFISLLNIQSPPQYFREADLDRIEISTTGITDERYFFYHYLGFVKFPREQSQHELRHPWMNEGLRLRNDPGAEPVVITAMAGLTPYYAGPRFHFMDFLTDPLLSRMPLPSSESWRPGHYFRPIPPGYMETLKSGYNQIEHPGLHEFYEHMIVITQSDIWSMDRIKKIIRMNMGYYDYLLPTIEEVDAMLPAQ